MTLQLHLVTERSAVRGILLTPAHEVLLLRIRPPGEADSFWLPPGGGIEAGEDAAACLRRELREELGLESFTAGPLVWLRQETFTWAGRRICQSEEYYVVEVEKFEPTMSDLVELQTTLEFRWWTARELTSTSERVIPLSLAEIVGRFRSEGAPRDPLNLEMIED